MNGDSPAIAKHLFAIIFHNEIHKLIKLPGHLNIDGREFNDVY